MGLFTDHPYTAVTATINQIVVAHDDEYEPEAQLPTLLDAIRAQPTSGGTEAARAVRKNLKHGSVKEQIRSLVVLELLVGNGGSGKAMRGLYNDHKLLACMSQCYVDMQRPGKVRRKIAGLAAEWRVYEDVSGYEGVSNFYKLVPEKTKLRRYRNTNVTHSGRVVPDFMRDRPDENYNVFNDEGNIIQGDIVLRESGANSRNSSRSSFSHHSGNHLGNDPPKTNAQLNKQFRIPKIDYLKERPKIQTLLAQTAQHSTALANLITQLPAGTLAIDDRRCYAEFDICRQLRRKILRYLQLVDSEEFLGSLIAANDSVIATLQRFSDACKEKHDDSYYETESEDERNTSVRSASDGRSGLSLGNNSLDNSGISLNNSRASLDDKMEEVLRNKRAPPPPPTRRKPLSQRVEEGDSESEEDPFGDTHMVVFIGIPVEVVS
ncbi:hypothetical protein BABINDRAFT_9033 [Babjeviella inositovora NRRL Y-12698]|uniref:VHS domain-containing protein n=1 Tax=Babjeviella inositovora NRRL Y-12698 TaxID=984486 RepID=A0A1E3QM73_9ASCO|nr:uncharacterized protein BABINDRAFT_9033 [Babjeviella inositovora NRRL Y-12698]ODQ78799.1 hypothetical protein BABINDRAFT_9033 [Babjeviella inositovora NRRL Y-12698]